MKKAFKKIPDLLLKNETRLLPGNLAYSFVFAIIPILSLIIYFLTTFNLSADLLQNFLVSNFPESIVKIVEPVFDNSFSLNSIFVIIISIVVVANGCNSIIITSNTVYGINDASLLKRYIKSIAMIIIMIGLFTFILFVPLLGRTIINIVGYFTDVISEYKTIINIVYFILQVPITILIIFLILKLIYTIAPDAKIPSHSVNKGSLFTTLSWATITWIFSYYINNIARYDRVYGNLANIIILLFYFFLLSYVFVIGLCINREVTNEEIEKTNIIKLEEIRKKIKEDNKK